MLWVLVDLFLLFLQYHHKVVVMGVLSQTIPAHQEDLVVEVVVDYLDHRARVVREILHQHHHLREIMVQQLSHQEYLVEEVVALVGQEAVQQEMVVMVLPLQFKPHLPSHMLVVVVVEQEILDQQPEDLVV